MCGIAGIHVKERYIGTLPIDSLADHLLLGIESRGRDATGYVSVGADGRTVKLEKNDERASKFIHGRAKIADDTRTLLLHTRAQTQGSAKQNENNHPVLYDSCFATHNGVIYNDDHVFQALGLERNAEVDSIAIPASLTYHGINELADIKAGLNALDGWMAIAAIDPVKAPGRLILAKGISSPLIVVNHRKFIMWASTEEAIKKAWGAVLGTPPSTHAMKSNGYKGYYSFTSGELWIIDGDELAKERFALPAARRSASGGAGFRHHGANGNYFNGYESDADDDWDGWYAGTGTGAVSRKWTCLPSFSECLHPCGPGCQSGSCYCYENSVLHPEVPKWLIDQGTGGYEWMRQVPDNGTAKSLSLVQRNSSDGLSPTAASLVERAAADIIAGGVSEDDEEFECESCFEFFKLKEVDYYTINRETFMLCNTCAPGNEGCRLASEPLTEETTAEEVDWEDETTLDPYVGRAMQNNALHQRACLEVAFELQTTVAFVDWILFRCPQSDINDDAFLKKMRDEIKREYGNGMMVAQSVAGMK